MRFKAAWRDPRGLSVGHVLTKQALGQEQLTNMVRTGKQNKEGVQLEPATEWQLATLQWPGSQ
jgi:hypothetical protein